MPGTKNIRVFTGWFGISKKSKAQESEICVKFAESISGAVFANKWEWSSDKTSFWVDNKNHYFNHECLGECDNSFDYPVPLKKCLVCNGGNLNTTKKTVGRVGGVGENTPIGQHSEYHLKNAKEDLKNNPRPEEGAIDWDELRDNL